MGDPALSLAQISLKVKRVTLRPLDSDAARGTRTRRPCSVVTVNGASITRDWHYEPSGNAVVFSPDATPEGGSLIEIDYVVKKASAHEESL